MIKYCSRCKTDTPHRKITERSQPDDPFTYLACNDCGEIHPLSFGKGNLK